MYAGVCSAGDRPILKELIYLNQPGLRIIKSITACDSDLCADLAYLLLNDDVTVKKLKMNYTDNGQFVRAVLREWLERDDDNHKDPAAPRTWAALVECIHDAGLPGVLAKAIRDACTTTVQSELVHNNT